MIQNTNIAYIVFSINVVQNLILTFYSLYQGPGFNIFIINIIAERQVLMTCLQRFSARQKTILYLDPNMEKWIILQTIKYLIKNKLQ